MTESDRRRGESEIVGSVATRTGLIGHEPVDALAGALDVEVAHGLGDAVPPLWHWMYLLPRPPQRELGPDGHPTTGIPSPPGPRVRRMFAGGRVTTRRPLLIGSAATRTTSVTSSATKQGRSGPLTFVTVRHEWHQNGELSIEEEQDVVYRSPDSGTLRPSPPSPPPASGPTLSIDVDERVLFRFSALTYNTHRIHYDLRWAAREGYDDLVVHGPLQAVMMAELMRRRGVDLVGATFAFRLVAPMIGPQTMTIVPADGGLATGAEARSQAGSICAVSTVSRR